MSIPIVVCNHLWQEHVEPIKDDIFEICRTCGIIRTIKKNNLNECLGSDYGRSYFEGQQWTIANGIPMNRHYTEVQMPYFLEMGIDKVFGNGQLLCVGPGIGQLIPQWLAWGWKVTCVEFGTWAATYVRHAYPPIICHCADFLAIKLEDKFDAIVANHVLEHFQEADRALEKMVSLLAPNGVIYVEIPTAGNLYVPDHWFHFAYETLPLWFQNLGLEIKANLVRNNKEGTSIGYHVIGIKSK